MKSDETALSGASQCTGKMDNARISRCRNAIFTLKGV